MYDPTFEQVRQEYGPHPPPDEFQELLSIGFTPDEAAAFLDVDILDYKSWIALYGEEVKDAQTQYNTEPNHYQYLMEVIQSG